MATAEVVAPPDAPFATQDLSLAAYLLMRDLRLVRAVKNPRRGIRYEFTFASRRESELALQDWVNSQECRYDAKVRDLKKLLHQL